MIFSLKYQLEGGGESVLVLTTAVKISRVEWTTYYTLQSDMG